MKNNSTSSSTKWRVVVDTNVFVSAFIYGGNPQKIVNLWLKDRFTFLLSPFLLTEILSTLERFSLTPSQTSRLKTILEAHSLKIVPRKKIKVCRDPQDNQVLSLCLQGKAHFLVTGDKDLLVLKNFYQTEILTPVQFLAKLHRAG